MPTTRTQAALRVGRTDDSGSVAQVTASLGIEPTSAHDVGVPRSARDPRPWANMHWALESDLSGSAALGDHLAASCDVVEGRRAALEHLAQEGFRLDWFCFVEVEHGQGGVSLEPALLRRMSRLPVALNLDIYGPDNE